MATVLKWMAGQKLIQTPMHIMHKGKGNQVGYFSRVIMQFLQSPRERAQTEGLK